MKLGEFELNKIYCMDCLEGLKKIPDDSVDLVITSPPYFNVQRPYQRKKGIHYSRDYGEVLYLIEDSAKEIFRVLKDDGAFFLNLGFSYSDGGVLRPFYIVNRLVKNIGFFCYEVIIWKKDNPIPLSQMSRLTNAFEYIFVLTKNIQWKYNVKKGDYKINVWSFPVVSQNQSMKLSDSHGAMFPLKLPMNCIEIGSKEGDIVLDPFIGSGTTAKACLKLNRKFIGFEINLEYFEMANKKIKPWLEQRKLNDN